MTPVGVAPSLKTSAEPNKYTYIRFAILVYDSYIYMQQIYIDI